MSSKTNDTLSGRGVPGEARRDPGQQGDATAVVDRGGGVEGAAAAGERGPHLAAAAGLSRRTRAMGHLRACLVGRARPVAKHGSKPSFSYQTRPELNRDELCTLFAGGVKYIQPGIESLSDVILRLMRKGTTGLRNLQLLRWCSEIGMDVTWRILHGFPGEPVSEYERMAVSPANPPHTSS